MLIGKDYWTEVRDYARRELGQMRAAREELEIRLHELNAQIVLLERVVDGLEPMVSDAPHEATIRVEGVADLELADAIREVLKQSEQYRTPRGVRDSLKKSGYDLNQHTNALASIHGVLKRLLGSGEVEQLESASKTYYRWKTARPEPNILEALKRSLEKPMSEQPLIERDQLESRLKKRG